MRALCFLIFALALLVAPGAWHHAARATSAPAAAAAVPELERWAAYPASWRNPVVDQTASADTTADWGGLRDRLKALGYVN